MFIMLAELRPKSQITIPKDIVAKLGLSEGDKLEVHEKDGMICIMPVAVYPKKYLNALRDEISKTKVKIAEGKQPSFDNVDALFAELEEN
jgi:AbrB family looped-hinge helix DNA binding protein